MMVMLDERVMEIMVLKLAKRREAAGFSDLNSALGWFKNFDTLRTVFIMCVITGSLQLAATQRF